MENAWNVELSGPDRAPTGLRYGSAVPREKEGPPAVSSCLPRPKTNSSAAAIDNCPFPLSTAVQTAGSLRGPVRS